MGLNLPPLSPPESQMRPAAGAGETQEVGGDPWASPHGLLFTKQRPILALLGSFRWQGQPHPRRTLRGLSSCHPSPSSDVAGHRQTDIPNRIITVQSLGNIEILFHFLQLKIFSSECCPKASLPQRVKVLQLKHSHMYTYMSLGKSHSFWTFK